MQRKTLIKLIPVCPCEDQSRWHWLHEESISFWFPKSQGKRTSIACQSCTIKSLLKSTSSCTCRGGMILSSHIHRSASSTEAVECESQLEAQGCSEELLLSFVLFLLSDLTQPPAIVLCIRRPKMEKTLLLLAFCLSKYHNKLLTITGPPSHHLYPVPVAWASIKRSTFWTADTQFTITLHKYSLPLKRNIIRHMVKSASAFLICLMCAYFWLLSVAWSQLLLSWEHWIKRVIL